jgi:hypothetical protein
MVVNVHNRVVLRQTKGYFLHSRTRQYVCYEVFLSIGLPGNHRVVVRLNAQTQI